eukprot:6876957-Prymnesium_polylepis.1
MQRIVCLNERNGGRLELLFERLQPSREEKYGARPAQARPLPSRGGSDSRDAGGGAPPSQAAVVATGSQPD